MIIGWILLLVLAVAAVAGRRLRRYPGGLRFAFGQEHAAARHDLDTARDALRELERAAVKELSGARAAALTADAAHRHRVRKAEERVVYLHRPDRGGFLDELGNLCLYQHVLAVRTEEWSGDLPLAGITVRSDHTLTAAHIYVTDPAGRRHLVTYHLEHFGEEYVRKFIVDVHNAMDIARAFQRDLPTLIDEAEAELDRARNDTTGQSEAGRRLDEITARQGGDPRIPRARHELDAAQARWQALTGRRPH
ncbi:hypothetical protein OG782_14700 [Streptomyces sp. NBC_00876]|uniref:hypothetical protein n=1 Tax=Streptomyces sp. NBC_00876 TaxID=2975853 RepID=UPI003869A63D|nr:hypothetical protein OG782_14700 [Streptomyces sp. NBC_00876]